MPKDFLVICMVKMHLKVHKSPNPLQTLLKTVDDWALCCGRYNT